MDSLLPLAITGFYLRFNAITTSSRHELQGTPEKFRRLRFSCDRYRATIDLREPRMLRPSILFDADHDGCTISGLPRYFRPQRYIDLADKSQSSRHIPCVVHLEFH